MPIFNRRIEPPPKESGSHVYRKYVREDFGRCCAYCLLHEIMAGGEDNFELDHFLPKSKAVDGAQPHDFYNLYYACHVCNHYKANYWPDRDLVDQGYRFVDTCRETFSEHFEAHDGGRWVPRSPAGRYTEARLRLNRAHLVELRMLLNDIARSRGVCLNWDRPLGGQIKEIFLRADID